MTFEQLFEKYPNNKQIAHKYASAYEETFQPIQDKKLKILEIGVCGGSSLKIWEEYFPLADIMGIDIDQKCDVHGGGRKTVRIGSQSDEGFLKKVVEEMGGLDVVIDDGSHQKEDIQKSFDVLFPLMNPRGIYLVEDMHVKVGYPTHDFFPYFHQLADDIQWNGKNHGGILYADKAKSYTTFPNGIKLSYTEEHVRSVKIFRHMAVVEKDEAWKS